MDVLYFRLCLFILSSKFFSYTVCSCFGDSSVKKLNVNENKFNVHENRLWQDGADKLFKCKSVLCTFSKFWILLPYINCLNLHLQSCIVNALIVSFSLTLSLAI